MPHDSLTRFLLEGAAVRGVIARLDRAWQEISSHAPYPPGVRGLLGECLTASALFAGDIKMAGSISIQVRGKGAVPFAVAECTSQGQLRGLAHWHDPVPERVAPTHLGVDALLAVTIEREQAGQRYQGMVPLVGATFAAAFESYFEHSEQLPTALLLEPGEQRCSGILLQQLPGIEGDARSVAEAAFAAARAALVALGPDVRAGETPTALLRRAFPERDVRVFPGIPLVFGCRCSRTRIEETLRMLGHDEALAALAESPSAAVEVRCEFCNRTQYFGRSEIERIFVAEGFMPGSRLVQ